MNFKSSFREKLGVNEVSINVLQNVRQSDEKLSNSNFCKGKEKLAWFTFKPQTQPTCLNSHSKNGGKFKIFHLYSNQASQTSLQILSE